MGSVGKAAKKVDIQADAFGDLDVGIEGDYQYDDFMWSDVLNLFNSMLSKSELFIIFWKILN